MYNLIKGLHVEIIRIAFQTSFPIYSALFHEASCLTLLEAALFHRLVSSLSKLNQIGRKYKISFISIESTDSVCFKHVFEISNKTSENLKGIVNVISFKSPLIQREQPGQFTTVPFSSLAWQDILFFKYFSHNCHYHENRN